MRLQVNLLERIEEYSEKVQSGTSHYCTCQIFLLVTALENKKKQSWPRMAVRGLTAFKQINNDIQLVPL